jgi:hypothetical protein
MRNPSLKKERWIVLESGKSTMKGKSAYKESA